MKALDENTPETPSADGAMAPAKRNSWDLNFSRRPEETESNAMGRNVIRPTVGGALTIKAYGDLYGDWYGNQLELDGLITALSDQAKAVSGGKLDRAEHMLTVQAHTLDAVYNALAVRAALNLREHFEHAECCLRLALKAQSQCRATLETLALMKNPAPFAFVRQANIGHAVQVNNGPAPAGGPSRAGETENLQNKLDEAQHGERLDTGATGSASAANGAANTVLETLGTVHGTEDSGGQGARQPER